ncbi:2-C-methyl-D-erythritol 4-phosphate cytidylyltransferase [Paenibacillus sp. 481]|uniref:2-C-methyl-D-erythritol 4-phosphate cytidylyltransferase n=1 Tax=Paenibacillus sp. 481 TaxID=2835869 RepID=UPI001E2DEBC7|nr:2-C-methyl-D-erythritol 4-phosphate cytidylyltransferase [Paenibacillus sp. 481]UHA71679.1 2-C-methyl-D-erythritol 4-phosphate cytidylyltransferase [Paenibacillus sp. 481]
MEQRFGLIIVAAGRGTRMGTRESKQFLMLEDKPVIVHTLERFEAMPECAAIALVTAPQDHARCAAWIAEYGLQKVTDVVAGGAERQHSVYAGLQAIQQRGLDYVLIHDGVRPFVERDKVIACFDAARQYGAAVLAVPVKDTIKQVNGDGVITATPDRRSLWAIQTPQAFRLSDVIRAHEHAQEQQVLGTDDAMLVERMGQLVHVVEGDYTNVKLTTPDDLDLALWNLSKRKS